MATKKTTTTKKSTEKESITPNIKVTQGGQKTEKPTNKSLGGKVISLNLKRASFFGAGPIWLTPTNYWVTIPNDLDETDYYIIKNALEKGTVVEGKEFIPPVDKADSTLDEFWLLIKNRGLDEETKDRFRRLLRTGTHQNWTVAEICAYCTRKETETKNRDKVLQFLADLRSIYTGPHTLFDEPDDAEGIKKVTVASDETGTTVSFDGPNESSANKADDKSSSDALDNLLN